MEPHFNLTEAVQSWLGQLEQRGTFTEDDLLELHSHLMDAIDSLLATGLSRQEAFLIACHRLGTAEVLGNEFGKLSRPLPLRREPVLLIAGVVSFMIIKNAIEAVHDFGTIGFAGYWGDSIITPLLDVSLCVLLIVGLLSGTKRLFGETTRIRNWFFHQLNQRPIWLTIAVLILLGISALCAYTGQHHFEDLVAKAHTEQWKNNQFRHIHSLFWLGFHLAWLLMFLKIALQYTSAESQTLVSRVKKASFGWVILSGVCLFTCCLGLSILGMRIIAPVDGIARFYICAGICCLISGLILSSSSRYSSPKRLLLSVAPPLIWYMLAVASAIIFREERSSLLTSWFPIRFCSSAFIGSLTGLYIGIFLQNRYRVKV